MRRYIPPILKGKKEKEKPTTKIDAKGEIDFSENFAMRLHTRRLDDEN